MELSQAATLADEYAKGGLERELATLRGEIAPEVDVPIQALAVTPAHLDALVVRAAITRSFRSISAVHFIPSSFWRSESRKVLCSLAATT